MLSLGLVMQYIALYMTAEKSNPLWLLRRFVVVRMCGDVLWGMRGQVLSCL